jgi:hypothetical protein
MTNKRLEGASTTLLDASTRVATEVVTEVVTSKRT